MFSRILESLIPRPLSAIEQAASKIRRQQFIRSGLSQDFDPNTSTSFIVGKTTHIGPGTGRFNILFGKNDEQVSIKYEGDIIFYFDDKDEVAQIRQAIVHLHDKLKKKDKREKQKKFDAL